MIEINIETKVKLIIAKGRNIVYYRSIDERDRATYIHVLRDFRKSILEVIGKVKDRDVLGFLNSLLGIIDPKVKTSECTGTIIKIKELYEASSL